MGDLIQNVDIDLKEGDRILYFKYIEKYDRYFTVIGVNSNKTSIHTHILKLYDINTNEYQTICTLDDMGDYKYYEIKDDVIVYCNNASNNHKKPLVNYMFTNDNKLLLTFSNYSNSIKLQKNSFTKYLNMLSNEIIFSIDTNIEYIFNDLLFFENIEKQKDHQGRPTGKITDCEIGIFNIKNHNVKYIKKSYLNYGTNREYNGYINSNTSVLPLNNDELSFNLYKNSFYYNSKKPYSSFLKLESNGALIKTLKYVSFDNRFIFINYVNKRLGLYDTLKEVELKDTIIYNYGTIVYMDVDNALIRLRNDFGKIQIISFRKYINNIYEKEKLEEKKDYIIVGEPDNIIDPGYSNDTKSSQKPLYLGKKVNIIDLSNMNDCWIKLKHHKTGKVYYKNPHTDETRDFIIDKSLIYYPTIDGETS